MREWELVIVGDGPMVDQAWAAELAHMLVPYDGVVTVHDGRVQANLSMRAEAASKAARVALELWCAMVPRAHLLSLVVRQVYTPLVPPRARNQRRQAPGSPIPVLPRPA